MNLLGLFFVSLAIIGWSAYPTLVSKIGGNPIQAIVGATWGTLIVATILIIVQHYSIPTGLNFWLSVVSGAAWAFGNVVTISAFGLKDGQQAPLGSAKIMPISTAFQIIANVLWGVVMLGNWASFQAKLWGTFAVFAIMFGAYLTTYQEHKTTGNKLLLIKAMGILLIAQIGYSLYGILPQYTSGIDGMHMFFPQAIGMAVFGTGLGLYDVLKNKHYIFRDPITYRQLISGFFFAGGALGYLVSAQPMMLGLASSFVLSQVSIVGATVSGILVMHVQKTKREWVAIIIGLCLIVVAAAITAFL